MVPRVIQIVPQMPTGICGIGDYSVRISDRLAANNECEIRWIAASSCAAGDSDGNRISLNRRSVFDLVTSLERFYEPNRTVIILQFSGYGYAHWALCYWLVRGLRRFLKRHRDARLLTMFHELWANGPLTSAAGWTMPFQRQIIKSLIRISHEIRTNRSEFASMIHHVCPDYSGNLVVQPVISNLGELTILPGWSNRKQQIVCFKPPSSDTPDGETYWQSWRRLVEIVKPERTIIAGNLAGVIPDDPSIEKRGMLSEEQASQLLSESRFALSNYFDGYLGKSGLFAAIAAHGLACFFPTPNHSESDGIYHKTHYLTPDDDIGLLSTDFSGLGMSLHDWYTPHNLTATARSYSEQIARMLI